MTTIDRRLGGAFPYRAIFFPHCRRPLMTAKRSAVVRNCTHARISNDSPRAVLTCPSGHLTLTDERRNLNLRPGATMIEKRSPISETERQKAASRRIFGCQAFRKRRLLTRYFRWRAIPLPQPNLI